MALNFWNPAGAPAPFSRYSLNVEIPAGARQLHISGQVGVAPDGALSARFEDQARQTLANVRALIRDAGMDWPDVVKLNAFLTRPQDVGAWRSVREAALGDAAPASTLLIVAGLAHPDWLIEVEAIAGRI